MKSAQPKNLSPRQKTERVNVLKYLKVFLVLTAERDQLSYHDRENSCQI